MSVRPIAVHDHVTRYRLVAGTVGVSCKPVILSSSSVRVEILRCAVRLTAEHEPGEPALGSVETID